MADLAAKIDGFLDGPYRLRANGSGAEQALATLPEATCAARWRLAQSRSVVRTSGTVCGGWSYEGEQYASCRGCAVGATRAGGAT